MLTVLTCGFGVGTTGARTLLSSSRSLGHLSKMSTRSATEPLVRNGLTGFEAVCLMCCLWLVVSSGWGTCWSGRLMLRGPQRVEPSFSGCFTDGAVAGTGGATSSSPMTTPFFRAFIRRFSSRATFEKKNHKILYRVPTMTSQTSGG